MARFRTNGIDDLIEDMKRLGELTGVAADRMLMAGAEEVRDAWRRSAVAHEHIDTGDMANSVGFAKTPIAIGGIRSIDIYPQGKDRKGVRNAEKAFILHYGSSSIRATHWVDRADDMAEGPVTRRMTEIWERFMRERGF